MKPFQVAIHIGDTVKIPVLLSFDGVTDQVGRVIDIRDVGTTGTGRLLIVRCTGHANDFHEWECNAEIVK